MIPASAEGGAKLPRAQSRAADDVKGRCRQGSLAEGWVSSEAATDFIRNNVFGIEIGPQHFSATKSQLKRREGGGAPEGKSATKGKRAPAATPVSPPAPAVQAAVNSQPDLLDTLEAVKNSSSSTGPIA